MSQPSQSNNFSHPGPHYGSYAQQETHGTGMDMVRETPPISQAGGDFQHLPAEVKLPPSFRPPVTPRSMHHAPHSTPNSGYPPPSHTNTAPMSVRGDRGGQGQTVGVADICQLLEETQTDNAELRMVINENNETIANKLKDLENLAQENATLTSDNEVLRQQLSASTNQFFEARVAVLGFKCRVMQLQAQGGSLQKQLPPPQQLSPHEVNAQITTLTQEKKKILNEIKSLEAVVSAERDKFKRLEDKKRIAEEERDRLQTKITQLEGEVRVLEDNLGEAQSHSYQEHSTRNQMSQEMRVLRSENEELKTQVQTISQTNTALQSQVHTLKANEKHWAEQAYKLQHEKRESEQPQHTPVPKPRTNIHTPQGQDPELDRLRSEIQGLRKKLDTEKSTRSTLESSLSKKSTEYQELMEKYNQMSVSAVSVKSQNSDEVQRLTEELAQLKVSESSLREKDSELQRMKTEKRELQSKVASLEKQKLEEVRKVKDERDGRIANLEERLRLASAVQSSSGAKSGASSGAMARRLNDALGKNKELELNLEKLRSNFEGDKEQWEREKQELLSEVEKLQTESGESIDNIVERLEFYEDKAKKLEEREASLTQEKASLEANLTRIQQEADDKHQLTQQLHTIREEFDEKAQEAAELRAQLDNVNREKESKTTKLHTLSNEYTDLKGHLQQAQERQKAADAEKRRVSEENRKLSLNVQQLSEVKVRLDTDKQTLENTVHELQGELSSMMRDYQSTGKRVSTLESDMERVSLQNRQLRTELDEKNTRIKQIENQRKLAQDRLAHMDVQLKAYQEDFERERQAREAAVKVKKMVEERIAKKEKEVKELRDRLNQQAMRTLNVEEQFDDGNYRQRLPPSESHSLSPTPQHNRSREHAQMGSDYSSQGSGDYRQRSQEHQKYSGSQPSRYQEDEPPPPVPPREKPQHGYPQHQQHFQGGPPPGSYQAGHLGGAQGGHPSGPPPGGHHGGPPPGSHHGGPPPGGHHGGPPPGGHHGGPPPVSHHGGPPPGGHHGGLMGGPQGVPLRHNSDPWTQQFPVSTAAHASPPRSRPMTTAQPGSQEMGTAGSGDMAQIGGQLATMPPHQGGGYAQQPPPGDMGLRRPPERRNDFSEPSTMPRNNLSGPQPQGRNNLDISGQPASQLGGPWVGPGEVINKAPPSMACPICGQQEFQTQTDLELHCAQCT